MTTNKEIETSLAELKRLTGLNLNITLSDGEDLSAAVKKLNSITAAYKEKHNKEMILRRWLTGEISMDEFFPMANRFHLSYEEKRIVYLVDISGEIDDSILEIFHHAFPDKHNVWIVPFNKNQIVIIYRFAKVSDKILNEIAFQIVDILNTELFLKAVVSYSDLTTYIDQLPGAFRQAAFALEVGKAFYSDRIIYAHNNLGIGRILYGLPKETCIAYITEALGNYKIISESAVFQSEIRHTVNSFLKYNLNIAETARQLHMHRNTLLYRLEQIQNESGLDVRKFDDAVKYKICSMLIPYID